MKIKEKERKKAWEKAVLLNQPVLIALTSGQENIKNKFSSEERTRALRKALSLDHPVLIELSLQVADETAIKAMAGQIIVHKIKMADASAVDSLLKIKSFNKIRYNDFVNEALIRENKDILRVLFRNRASQEEALKNAFERAELDDILLLMEVGCKLTDYDLTIKHIVSGGSTQSIEAVRLVLNMAPNQSMSVEEFKRNIRHARIYALDRTADFMEECMKLECYRNKFKSEDLADD